MLLLNYPQFFNSFSDMHISLATLIHAPIERVFDLSRSIDLHQQSMRHISEKAIAGKTSGLISESE
jgi:hypothetical protein